MRLVNSIKSFFEKQAFGVCDYLGKKMGIRSARIRTYFIYVSFITLGSPLIIYLILAFWLENRNWFKQKQRSIWEM